MQKIILTVGIPASGKSFWTKTFISQDPNNWVRVNNDDIRAMTNGSVYSSDYEKLITETRNFMIREALKRGKNVIIDNLNINKRHFDDVCKIASSINEDVQVLEKLFYIDLDEAILRDSKRDGKGKVGETVIKKWWKDSGKEQHKFYQPRTEIFLKRTGPKDKPWTPMPQDATLPKAVIFDNDGTICLIGNRSPYDASKCDLVDKPHEHVIEVMRLYFKAGYKILFVSGRDEKDRAPTERFYQKHFPEIEYELYMRPAGNKEKDVIIKENIFKEKIKDKYFVSGWYDDRLQVSRWVFENGLGLFRVNDPEATF